MTAIRNLGFGFLGHHRSEEIMALVTTAEEAGFTSAWIAEDYYYGGAFSIAAACAAHTKSILLGIGVINPYTRHPVLSAMEAASVDSISGGRLILGMGSSNRRWMETDLHIPYRRPITATTEAVQIIRRLIHDGTICYQGECFQTGEVTLSFTPCRRDLPVYMGVKGDRALYLAGQTADGVLLSAGCPVEFIPYARERIAAGAASVGRDPAEIHLAVYLPTCIRGTTQEAVEYMREPTRRYLAMHGGRPILTSAGFAPEEVEPFREAFLEGRRCDLPVTDEMVRRVVIAGDAAECRRRVQSYIDAGVEMPVCFEIEGEDPMVTLAGIREALLR